MEVYRFRSIDRLLGEDQELENRTIYFASPDQLNDPMEGFRDIVWRGDRIVWENFYKHFVYCLYVSSLRLTNVGDSEELGVKDIPIRGSWDRLPTSHIQELFGEIWQKFLDLPNIPEFIEAMANANRKIRYRELGLYLRFIHRVLLDEIEESYIARGLMRESTGPRPPGGSLTVQDYLDLILMLIMHLNQAQSEEKANAILQKAEEQYNALRVALQLKNSTPPGILRKNIQLTLFDFPRVCLKELERLLSPNWYTACFTKSYHNSSVWGHYGDQHRGACLIFKPVGIGASNGLNLNYETGVYAGQIKFSRINYVDQPGEVNFFGCLSSLPDRELRDLWFTDEMGNTSRSFPSDIGASRERYWDSFIRDIATKTKDWEYEQEYRLILQDIGGHLRQGRQAQTILPFQLAERHYFRYQYIRQAQIANHQNYLK